jgi:anti-sigma factor RsiW
MAESADHLSCQDVVELVTDYLEESLSSEDASLFEQHLNFCEGCVWYVGQLRTTIDALGGLREEDISPEAKDRLMGAFRNWKRS